MTPADGHKCAWQQEALALRAALAAQSAELEALKRRVYGKKSEKLPRPAEELKKRGDVPSIEPEALRHKRAEAKAWKQALPEEPVVHPAPPPPEPCKLCGTRPHHPMPPEISFEYEWVPGKLKKLRHMREGIRCDCGSCIVRGPPPVRVIDKAQYGPGLAAHAVVSKCCDAMPLYRLAQQLARAGVPVSATSLGDLFHRSAELLAPLYRRLLELVAQEPVVNGDETRIQVQQKEKTRRAWMWVFLARSVIVYVFSASRSGDTPKKVLGATGGTLVVDAYTGYNQVCTPEQWERAGCMAHVRRKAFDALPTAPAMREMLDLILDVYKVEHEAKERGIVRSPAHRELRQTRSKPVMDKLHAWLTESTSRCTCRANRRARRSATRWTTGCI